MNQHTPKLRRVPRHERNIEAEIRRLLNAAGAVHIKYHVGPRGGVAGTTDLLGCYRGRSFCIEVKRPGEVSRPLQRVRQEEWRQAGAIVFVATRSQDVVQQLLLVVANEKMS